MKRTATQVMHEAHEAEMHLRRLNQDIDAVMKRLNMLETLGADTVNTRLKLLLLQKKKVKLYRSMGISV